MKKPAFISSRSPSGERTTTSPQSDRQWTFHTKHAAVLLHLARHLDETMRSMAATLGLTERPAATVFADLRAAGYITVRRRERRDRIRGDFVFKNLAGVHGSRTHLP